MKQQFGCIDTMEVASKLQYLDLVICGSAVLRALTLKVLYTARGQFWLTSKNISQQL